MREITVFRHDYMGIYTNSFLLRTRNYNIFIDAGLRNSADKIRGVLGEDKMHVVLLTHGHWDHIGLYETIHGASGKIFAHEGDAKFLRDFEWHWEIGFGRFEDDFDIPPERREIFWGEIGAPVSVDRFIRGGDVLSFDDLSLRVVELPGHSAGSVGFYDEESGSLFTGDALMGTGFFGGMAQFCNYALYRESMQKIIGLNPKSVYTGHTSPLLDGSARGVAEYALDFAEKISGLTEEFVRTSEGEITLHEAIRFVCGKTGKKIGGGACVTVLNLLNRMGIRDERAAKCAAHYECGV